MIREVKILETGEESIDFLEKEIAKDKTLAFLPDLIFMDLNLPGEHGLKILSKIKSYPSFQSTPVIVLTASDSKEDLANSYKKGGTIFMRKPINRNVLTDVLSHMKITGAFKKVI